MAMPRSWLPRAEDIIEVLRRMKSKHLDRSAVEELFQLQRRAANELMSQAGAPRARKGSAALIERSSLLKWTEKTFKEESWLLERKKETENELSRSMAEVRALRESLIVEGRAPLSFPIVEETLRATCASLPSSIYIGEGRIEIAVEAGDPDDMTVDVCQRLYELAMVLANDSDGFRNLIAPKQPHECPAANPLTGPQYATPVPAQTR